jgi:hypothetical protein
MQPQTYVPSVKKLLLVSAAFITTLSLAFAFARGFFDLGGLGLGAIAGGLFALFPAFYSLGVKIEITDRELRYSPHALALLINRLQKKVALGDITRVRLGLPRKNIHLATFAAINIVSPSGEITLNPDLFDPSTLHKLFRELQDKNPHINFDSYAQKLINNEEADGLFSKTVFRNAAATMLLMLIVGIVALGLFRLGLVSKEAAVSTAGLQLIFMPLLYNFIVSQFKKTRSR